MNKQGRQTFDPKVATVKLRISENMRSKIEKKAKMRNMSLSEYIRKLIEKDLTA